MATCLTVRVPVHTYYDRFNCMIVINIMSTVLHGRHNIIMIIIIIVVVMTFTIMLNVEGGGKDQECGSRFIIG